MPAFDWHDLHIHTRPHSPDAHWRATLPRMLKQAAKRGVSTVGLANHLFPNSPPNLMQQVRRDLAQHQPNEMIVLCGAELCVLDETGALHLQPEAAAELDFVLAGPHHFKQRWVVDPICGDAAAFIAQQHQMLLGAARQPLVNGLAHPWVINIQRSKRLWGFSPTQFLAAWSESLWAELGATAANHNTALEIGMGIHLMAEHQGDKFWQAYCRGLQAAQAAGARFFFGSDAHHLHIVARLDWLEPTLRRLGIQPNDIISPQEWVRS